MFAGLQLVHEISSFPEVTCKRGVLKNFSKFPDKHKNQPSAGILLKGVPKHFAKLAEKNIFAGGFFNKVAAWKPETPTSRHWRCYVK